MSDREDIIERLVSELHRRTTHFNTCIAGKLNASEEIKNNVYGELIGIRAALGIALGHERPYDIPKANAFYHSWILTAPPQTRCHCTRCTEAMDTARNLTD